MEANKQHRYPGIMRLGDSCCGCGACAASCGKSCIEMRSDKAGFLYPYIDASVCSHCGICEKACPVIQDVRSEHNAVAAYWAQAISRELLGSSSSGGVFGLLAQYVIDRGGLVCGAAFSEDFTCVRHVLTEGSFGLERIKCSKYVQSSIDHRTYASIKHAVMRGQTVLFSGTACQVKGLCGYLGNLAESENLLCVDVICHGAPSPRLWSEYVRYLGALSGSAVSSFNFRCKETGWETYSLSWRCGEERHSVLNSEDWYMKAFLRNASLRPSCFSCSAKGGCGSDITLGDYWGIAQAHPEVDLNPGVSAVLVNTQKGQQIFEEVQGSLKFGKTTFEKISDGNPSLTNASLPHASYRPFVHDIGAGVAMSDMIKKWSFKPNLFRRICNKAKSLLHGF